MSRNTGVGLSVHYGYSVDFKTFGGGTGTHALQAIPFAL
jgi:hypothetical protein